MRCRAVGSDVLNSMYDRLYVKRHQLVVKERNLKGMSKKKCNKKQWNLLLERIKKKNWLYKIKHDSRRQVIIKSNYLQYRQKNEFKIKHLKIV
jgi:hypothetical protein